MNMQVSRHCEEGVPELYALLNMMSSASQDSEDIHVFYENFFSKSILQFIQHDSMQIEEQ